MTPANVQKHYKVFGESLLPGCVLVTAA